MGVYRQDRRVREGVPILIHEGSGNTARNCTVSPRRKAAATHVLENGVPHHDGPARR